MWGTFDLGKPRVRILERGLRMNGIEVILCHHEVWNHIDDKSQIKDPSQRLRLLFKWLLAYPSLIYRYLRQPRHDAVLVSYLGHLDVLVLWLFAKLRGVPIIWDVFLSLYNTIVEDRRILSARNPLAKLIWVLEWLACRFAKRVIFDTRAHADYFVSMFGLRVSRSGVVLVGAEPEVFPLVADADVPVTAEKRVLFYGQFIPLHGIETIIRAARETRDEKIRWVIIGKGQEQGRIKGMLDETPLSRVECVPWVNYPELTKWISRADVCLGIFGDSVKAACVIPNKVFQILMSGKPLITRDSPAIRELLSTEMPGIWLVPPADAEALAKAVRESLVSQACWSNLHFAIRDRISPCSIGYRLAQIIRVAVSG
jgi:glycosyltransferase involved in cell wall biosynthesis